MLFLFGFPSCCIQTQNCLQVLDVSERLHKALWLLPPLLTRLIFLSVVVYQRYEQIWLGLHHPLIILLMVCSEARAKKIEIKIYHLKQKTEILLKIMIQTFPVFLSRP